MQRSNAQPSFTDFTVADLGGKRSTAFFARGERLIPFQALADAVAGVFCDDHPQGGAPHWPVLTMIKILFVQKYFGMSDPMAEEMLQDRISFRRFVGLSFDDKTPDQSTIWKFRERLVQGGHASTLFDKTLEILNQQGVVLQNGTLIAATIIPAPLGRKRADGSRTADLCASKTAKNGRAYHGYRAHVATDRQGIVTKYIVDTASESEHTHFDELAKDETHAVFADSGCRSKARVEKLRERGVFPGICHRRVRGQKELMPLQKRFNRLVSGIRAFVEDPFASIKRMLPRLARYRTLRRNAVDFGLCAMIHNWTRAMSLQKAS